MCDEKEIIEIIIPILNEAYKIESTKLEINYNPVYILNVFWKSKKAMNYLNRLQITDENIDNIFPKDTKNFLKINLKTVKILIKY